MIKQPIYKYLGTNGVIESPVHLEDIYYVRKTNLIAERGKILTNGKVFMSSVIVTDDEVNNWYEVPEAQAKEDL